VLALLGMGTFVAVRATGKPLQLLLLPAIVLIFLPLRINGLVLGRSAVDLMRSNVSQERTQSLEFRLDNEDMLLKKAKQRWIFGWGGWGRNRVYDQQGQDLTVTDGQWIIQLGTHGVVGLISLYGLLLLGVAGTAMIGNESWQRMKRMEVANLAGLAVICSLAAIDSIPNAMALPIFTVVAGALVSIAVIAYSRSDAIEPALIVKA